MMTMNFNRIHGKPGYLETGRRMLTKYKHSLRTQQLRFHKCNMQNRWELTKLISGTTE